MDMMIRNLLLSVALIVTLAKAYAIERNHFDRIAAGYSSKGEFTSGLSPKTADSIRQIHEEHSIEIRAHGDALENLRKGGASDQQRVVFATTDKERIYENFTKRVFSSLSTSEADRLRRLACREIGPRVLRFSEAARLIHLSEQQRLVIETIEKKTNEKRRAQVIEPANALLRQFNQRVKRGETLTQADIEELQRKRADSFRDAREIHSKLNKQAEDRILALLTAKQKAAWDRLIPLK
jgi:hypothetical protein